MRGSATPPERVGLARLARQARAFFPDRERAMGTREEVQARFAMPIWGHPPTRGDTFAACDRYLELLRSCERPELAMRIEILAEERRWFDERSPRIRGMGLGYCEAEAARRPCG